MTACRVWCADVQDVTWLPISVCSYTDYVAVFRFMIPDNGVVPASLSQLLSAGEHQRAQRYHKEKDSRRFIYTRSLLKVICGNYINQYPDQIQFTVGATKKPELSGNTGWHINVSHSGNWILLSIGRVSIGVDIEQINPQFSFHDILATSFSSHERAYINADAENQRRFYQLWTRKEALMKATGKGMDNDFSQVPSLDGLHVVDSSLIGGTGNWMVRSFAVAADCHAAVAYQETPIVPKFYTLNSSVWGQ